MKSINIILSSIIITSACAAFAQENIRPGVAPIVSPQLDENGAVTFRLFAPNAKSVQLEGNILSGQKMVTEKGDTIPVSSIEMVPDNGVWSVTLQNLPADLYSYNFNVDGVKVIDPVNVHTERDVMNVSNVVLVPGEASEDYAIRAVPHGTVSQAWYHSSFKDSDRRLTIYTPAGYEAGTKRYPVLYLLHGMGGDETAWPTLGRATQILDNMIAAGTVEPMIVVMPNGNIDRDAAPGQSPLGFEVPEFYLPHTMDGSFEKHFPEIIEYIDSNYRTINDKDSRAIAGLSMGGFHSLNTAAAYPDKFSYLGLFSSAINPREFTTELPEIYANRDQKIRDLNSRGLKKFWIGIGVDDFLYGLNKDFRADLDADGIPYIYYESDGGHEWKNWRKYLHQFLPLLFK